MAGTIDQLNFEVILDDKEFTAKVQQDIKLASQLNTSLSSLLNIKKQVGKFNQDDVNNNRKAQQILKDNARAQEAITREKLKTEGVQKRINAQIERATKGYQSQSRILNELKGIALGYLSVQGAGQLLSSLVRVTGEFELQKTTLAAMLGDLNQAEGIITRIQGLAVESPFQFKELTTYAKQLSAFSVPAQELYDTTKMLADISAGLGVGMDRIVLAYGQVRSAAFLRGQEVRQFTEAGIPILNELAKQFSELEGRAVSAGEVFDKISARLVPFEMVAKVFKDMTSEGGKFYNMQEIQAETLRGKISNLKDAYEIMLNEIGSSKSSKLKGAVDFVRNLMENWEKVGNVLKTLIVTFGLYKATLGAVWTFEKILSTQKMVDKYHALNARMIALTGSTNKLATAMRAMGVASKTSLGLWIAALGALSTIIVTAITNAADLRKELEKIISEESSSSSKTIKGLDELVDKLEGAVQGSQNYRDAISEMNRKYGEYLPNLLTEKTALEDVKVAAEAAATAIRNKAKASAFEKGSAAIEEDYGKRLSNSMENFKETLLALDPSISGEYATEFMKNFKNALAKEGASMDVLETFRESFDKYFGEGTYEKFTAKYLKPEALEKAAEKYAKVVSKINKAEKELEDDINERFDDAEYSSLAERKEMTRIKAKEKKLIDSLRQARMTQEEFNDAMDDLNIEKLEYLVEYYNEIGRIDKAKEFQKQLDALTKMQKGWKGIVNETLKGQNLTKNTSFGLWTDDYTQSVEYIDSLIKRYKELKEQIANIKTFDADQAKRLTQEKKTIEAIAKALKIDINALTTKKGSTGKSQAQKDLEEQIRSVQKLQDAYEKLRPYLNDVQMKTTLKSLFPNIKAGVIDSLDFNAELERLADRLEEFDEDAAQRLRDTIGKDVAGTIAESFKAVEQYKKMLDSWLGEDFELSGSGVSFDISKIIRNLNNEYAKIDQKRAKALDMLNKAQMGDEVALAKVREVYGDEVWQKYLVNGKRVIEDLARMEKQESKKTADEKIRDLANKYVKEQLTSKNVDLTDFEDKTLAQIQTQIDRIKEIRDAAQKEANKAMVEIALGNLDDGQYARWQMLIDVLKQLDIIISDTEEEKFKTKLEKASKLAENISNSVSTIGDALSSLGNEINNDVLSKLGGGLSEIAGFAQGLTSNIKTLAEETKDIDWENDSWKDLNDSAKGGVIGIIAGVASLLYNRISGMITSAYDRQRALTEATYEYRDILIDIRRESYSGIFGTDEMGLATENVKILNELMEDYKTSLDDFNKSKFQGYKSGLGREGMKNQSLSDMMTSISESQGWDLYLENGELNIAALEAYYDAYSSRLTKKQRDLVLALIESGKAVDDAAAQQSEYLTSLFGNVADNIATSMIDAFLESGDAAIDMGNIISDVSKQMVADLIKALYLMPILNDYKDKIAAVDADTTLTPTENTEQKLQLLESALQQIAGQSDAITETIARFQDYLGKPGEETSNLGDGIKGITEDTANLLASYLNAIRADVSFSKTLWIRMDANTQRIAAAIEGFSAPSLMEYQAQIAANTYNTSVATQSILATLRTVVDVRQGRVKVS